MLIDTWVKNTNYTAVNILMIIVNSFDTAFHKKIIYGEIFNGNASSFLSTDGKGHSF